MRPVFSVQFRNHRCKIELTLKPPLRHAILCRCDLAFADSKIIHLSRTEEEYDFIQPGIRIVVPFGNTKKYAALSHRTHQNTPPYEAKSIEYIIDQ